MGEVRKCDVFLLPVACLSIWLPVGVLCACLLSSSTEPLAVAGVPVALASLAGWIPFAVLAWRIAFTFRTEKLLRLMLVLAGAAGVITPVALCQSHAFGLAGIWQLIWCIFLAICAVLLKRDRISAVAAWLSSVVGVPITVYAFILASM